MAQREDEKFNQHGGHSIGAGTHTDKDGYVVSSALLNCAMYIPSKTKPEWFPQAGMARGRNQ